MKIQLNSILMGYTCFYLQISAAPLSTRRLLNKRMSASLQYVYRPVEEDKSAGINLGSAGSYALSGLFGGGIGRLISGKKHAGLGWGTGIAPGILANYLRRKSYYGKLIRV